MKNTRSETPVDATISTVARTQPDTLADAEPMDREWLTSLLRPLLVVGMVSMIDIVLLAFLRQYAPDMAVAMRWSIVGMGILAAIVGCATTSWLALPAQRLRRSAGYRLAEILLLAAVTRALLWLADGTLPSPLVMLNDPTGVLADGAFLFALIVVFFTWYAATDFTNDLVQMALQPDELWINRRANVRFADSARPAPTDRAQILRGFVARWVGWGIVLTFIAATLRMGITRPNFWALGRLDVEPLVVGAVLTYFLIGLLLISQGQLAVLRARWTLDHLPTAPAITHNWPIYTLLVLLGFAIVAAFLPLGDTYLLSVVLGTILNALFAFVYLVFRLLMMAFLMLLSLLPFTTPPAAEAPPPPPAQNLLEPPPEILVIPPWVGGAFFWLSVALLLGYAAYFYFSDKEASLRWLHQLWAHLMAQWRFLFGAAQRWYVQLQPGNREQARAMPRPSSPLVRRWLPWRLLSPAQRVRLLYFQLLAAAEQRAAGRRVAETPDRFAPRLTATIVATEEEAAAIDRLTAAFVDVRYAGRAISAAESEQLRQTWKRLRAAFAPKAGEKPAP